MLYGNEGASEASNYQSNGCRRVQSRKRWPDILDGLCVSPRWRVTENPEKKLLGNAKNNATLVYFYCSLFHIRKNKGRWHLSIVSVRWVKNTCHVMSKSLPNFVRDRSSFKKYCFGRLSWKVPNTYKYPNSIIRNTIWRKILSFFLNNELSNFYSLFFQVLKCWNILIEGVNDLIFLLFGKEFSITFTDFA